MGGHVARMEKMMNVYIIFGRKTWREETTRKTQA
jgi:hypothetical protein